MPRASVITSQHVASVLDVPHVPDPTVPVNTFTVIEATFPLASAETVLRNLEVLHVAAPVEFCKHSSTYSESLALNPEPLTVTDAPSVSPVVGVATTVGVPLAEAAVTGPSRAMPVRSTAAESAELNFFMKLLSI